MEGADPRLLQSWIAYWEDLVEFEIMHVVFSTEAAEVALSGRDHPHVVLWVIAPTIFNESQELLAKAEALVPQPKLGTRGQLL